MNSAYHQRVAFPTELGKSTSKQLKGMSPMVVVPVGSIEQHGPHLPLDTDTRIAAAVADAAVRKLGTTADGEPILLAPAVAYGASGEHEGFPGTVSIGTAALEYLLVEYARSAGNWARRMVFCNAHGGNIAALTAAVCRLRAEGRDAAWCPVVTDDGDAHAGHTETSVLLHISPSLVCEDECRAGNVRPLAELMPMMLRGGVGAVSEAGVLGDPTTATATEGERIFTEMVDDFVARIDHWTPGSNGMLRGRR